MSDLAFRMKSQRAEGGLQDKTQSELKPDSPNNKAQHGHYI